MMKLQIERLMALKDEVTEEQLDDNGRHFTDGNYDDLTQCHHGDTGNFRNRADGQALALLWNLWKAGALDGLTAPAPAPTPTFVDPTDPAVKRFEKALWELGEALRDLGVDTVQGPKDLYIVFGDETFAKLRAELISRDTLFDYFTRPKRKNPDPDISRWMRAGIQFGDIRSLSAAAAGEPFWPAPKLCSPPGVRFAGGCPSRRGGK